VTTLVTQELAAMTKPTGAISVLMVRFTQLRDNAIPAAHSE
jgi:hypothetical protein